MRRLRRFLASLLLAGLIGGGPLFAADSVPVRVGVLAYRGAERALAEWEPTIRHLNASLPGMRFEMVPLDLAEMRAAVAGGRVDFFITNTGNYVELETSFGASRIATVESGSLLPSQAIGSAVLVRADRQDLTDWKSLSGKTIAAVAPDAFGGFQVAWREMDSHGVDPFKQSRLNFVGFPIERVVSAVLDGKADAGIVRSCLPEKLEAEGLIPHGALRVLETQTVSAGACAASTRLYPDWPFAKTARTPADTAKKVGIALLSMPTTSGHAWTVPVDYQPVHDLFRQLRIGPYAQHQGLLDLLRAYWHWLAIAGVVIVWWIIHVVRVEHLVRLRTAELRAEMDERRKAEETARRHREELDHVSRLSVLGEMATSIAHELNQPLAAIANYARGCNRHMGESADPFLHDGLTRIGEQAERAGGIIHRIRGFARKQTHRRQPVRLDTAIRNIQALFTAVSSRRGIDVKLHLPPSGMVLPVDPVQIQQVMLNLMQNAADAMAESPTKTLTITLRPAEDGAEIIVQDTGPGLTAEARERLFTPFFTTKETGVGLGLSLSRTIVEAHGGRLWCEEPAEGGVKFHVLLPWGKNAEQHA